MVQFIHQVLSIIFIRVLVVHFNPSSRTQNLPTIEFLGAFSLYLRFKLKIFSNIGSKEKLTIVQIDTTGGLCHERTKTKARGKLHSAIVLLLLQVLAEQFNRVFAACFAREVIVGKMAEYDLLVGSVLLSLLLN